MRSRKRAFAQTLDASEPMTSAFSSGLSTPAVHEQPSPGAVAAPDGLVGQENPPDTTPLIIRRADLVVGDAELAHPLLDVGFRHVFPFARHFLRVQCRVHRPARQTSRRGRQADHGWWLPAPELCGDAFEGLGKAAEESARVAGRFHGTCIPRNHTPRKPEPSRCGVAAVGGPVVPS